MIPQNVVLSLRENGFDSYWHLPQREIDARKDSRPQLQGLIREAEDFASRVFAPEWLPEEKTGYLTPLKGLQGEPDVLLHRYKAGKTKVDVEMVCGEFSITLNVANPQVKPIPTSEAALAAYRLWSSSIINPEKAQQSELIAKRVESYWIVSRVFEESGPAGTQKRYTPWTWLESVRLAIDSQGKWLALGVSRLPDRVDSMPKGGRGRSQGSWFDYYVSSLEKP